MSPGKTSSAQSSSCSSRSMTIQGKCMEWVDATTRMMVRRYANQQEQRATLQPGPNGFGVAKFPDEDIMVESDCPNLVLMAVPISKAKPRKKKKISKKPCTAKWLPPISDLSPSSTKRKYGLMWYKNTWKVGLRRLSNKKQILQYGTKSSSKERLMEIGEQGRSRLESGEAEEEVVQWIKEQCI